jgi:ABC-type hemin transport system ATPase subunit
MRKSQTLPAVVALEKNRLPIRCSEVAPSCGENGACKFTLMKILGGVHQPDAREILIEGIPVEINGVTGHELGQRRRFKTAKNSSVVPYSPHGFMRRIAFAVVGFQHYGDGVAVFIFTGGAS